MGYDEKLSDSNDADFEIEPDSVQEGIDQELCDLARDFGLLK